MGMASFVCINYHLTDLREGKEQAVMVYQAVGKFRDGVNSL